MELTIFTVWGDCIVCRSFTNVDPDFSGIEIYRDNERLGSIINVDLPDEEAMDDEEAMEIVSYYVLGGETDGQAG